VKHRFLLDENIIHFYVKRVDEKDAQSLTSVQLIDLIGKNCHTVVVDRVLADKYEKHIGSLAKKRELVEQAVSLLREIVRHAEKLCREEADAPALPAGLDIPAEDEYVVAAALISHPIVVTGDEPLREAIRRHHDMLRLVAVSPTEALELAKDS
jgi:rRNA-processing protein FCF1